MNIKNLAKVILPFDLRRRIRLYQNKLSAVGHSFRDISHRSNKELHPIPPPLLRFRVHGDMDLLSFVNVGRRCAQDIQTTMQLSGVSISSLQTVLDFGCGCGRTLNWLSKENGAIRFFGTDIDEEAIEWCRGNFTDIEFLINGLSPPLSFSGNTFDLVYAISVFSHLDEEDHLEWLRELRRVLRPGGFLLVSYHGAQSQTLLSAKDRKLIANKGFLFKVEGLGKHKLNGLPDTYQTAYVSTDYINEYWSELFRIEHVIHDGMNAHQSVVLMRKTSTDKLTSLIDDKLRQTKSTLP